MKSNKGCYISIMPDVAGGVDDWIIEVGNDFDAFKIAVNFEDLINIKNKIIKIEEDRKNDD